MDTKVTREQAHEKLQAALQDLAKAEAELAKSTKAAQDADRNLRNSRQAVNNSQKEVDTLFAALRHDSVQNTDWWQEHRAKHAEVK